MKTFRRLQFLSVLVGWALLHGEALAQTPPAATSAKQYTNNQHFILPLMLDDKERASLQDVQLFVKNGPNGMWLCKETVPATQSSFDCRMPGEGEYWFTIAGIDKTGKQTPADTQSMPPGLIVVVDTTPPEVSVQTLPPSAQGVLMQCKVKDANADMSKVKLELQLPNKTWKPLEALTDQTGVFRLPGPALPEDVVRATATDRAGNTTSKTFNVASTFAAITPVAAVAPHTVESRSDKLNAPSLVVSSPGPSLTTTTQPSPDMGAPNSSRQLPELTVPTPPRASPDLVSVTTSRPTPEALSVSAGRPVPELSAPSSLRSPDLGANTPVRQLVNATHVSLEYAIEQQGPTGVSKVEVYATCDNGMTWQNLHEDTRAHSPVEFDLPGEGVYGVALVVTNGTGVGATPPQRGETPDYWVEVDLTRPAAQLMSVAPGVGKEAGVLHITWAANDKNLGMTPIDLYYTTKRGGQWEPIARGLKNDGAYRWTLPKNAGPEFYVRMDVTDQAGNLARCESAKPVIVDLVKPKAKVLTITARASRLTPALGN